MSIEELAAYVSGALFPVLREGANSLAGTLGAETAGQLLTFLKGRLSAEPEKALARAEERPGDLDTAIQFQSELIGVLRANAGLASELRQTLVDLHRGQTDSVVQFGAGNKGANVTGSSNVVSIK